MSAAPERPALAPLHGLGAHAMVEDPQAVADWLVQIGAI